MPRLWALDSWCHLAMVPRRVLNALKDAAGSQGEIYAKHKSDVICEARRIAKQHGLQNNRHLKGCNDFVRNVNPPSPVLNCMSRTPHDFVPERRTAKTIRITDTYGITYAAQLESFGRVLIWRLKTCPCVPFHVYSVASRLIDG